MAVSCGQCERERTREINSAPGASAESGSTALTNEVGGSVEVGRKEMKLKLVKIAMEKKRELDSVLNSLNRFLTSNFAGLAHFLSRSFIEGQPVGVRA